MVEKKKYGLFPSPESCESSVSVKENLDRAKSSYSILGIVCKDFHDYISKTLTELKRQ